MTDFTLGGRDDAAARIDEPIPCGMVGDEQTYSVDLITHGSNAEAPADWLLDELLPVLASQGITPEHGWVDCSEAVDSGTDAAAADKVSYGIIIHDWAEVDLIVESALDLATQNDSAVELRIAVEAEDIPCAHVACGA